MTKGDVLVDRSDGVTTLRLSNPARRNAISASMWRRLIELAKEISDDGVTRAVVIRGAGEQAFSAGADISDFSSNRSGEGNSRAYDDLVEAACRAVEAIAVPTLAVVTGPCIGAGNSLASSCDLIIATDDSVFAVPAARLGLGYDPRGVERLVRVFGLRVSRELLYLAGRLPARRLLDLGCIYRLTTRQELESVVSEVVQLLSDNAPLTLRAAKLAVRAVTDATLADAALRAALLADASLDYQEGRAAFAEKRAPRFVGR